MRLLTRWAARLYPAAWRARYGDELEILMEDAGPCWTDVVDLLWGAMNMQMRSVGFWKIAAAFTVAGALVSAAWSLAVPDRYVSSAVLRVTDPTSSHTEAWRHLQAVRERVFSRQSLTDLIVRQRLYERERARDPLEDVIQNMRRYDLQTALLNDTQFTISFASGDPAVAQSTVHAIVAALAEANMQVDRSRAGKINLEVLEPASLPTAPSGPNRAGMIQRGLLTGLVLGILCGGVWSIVRSRQQWSFKRLGAFAAAGMAIGITAAMLTSDEYVSTAVLRTTDPNQLELVMRNAVSRDALAALIQRDKLYPRELASGRMDQAVERMRSQAIRIQLVQMAVPHPANSTPAFTISFRSPDRYNAQRVTRDLVAQIMTAQGPPVEVLDPASMPQAPSSPNRPQIAALGILAGVLLGLAASRVRRPATAAA